MIYVLVPTMFLCFGIAGLLVLVAIFKFSEPLGFAVVFWGLGYGAMMWLEKINAAEKLNQEMIRIAKEAMDEEDAA